MSGKKNQGARSPEVIFRSKLQAFISGASPATKAREVGIKYKRFHRWLTDGIKRPNHHSLADVEKLARAMGLEDWHDLWRDGGTAELERQAVRRKVDALLQDETSRQTLAKAVEAVWQEREKRLARSKGSSEQHHD
jgi:hypothetical protein